MTTQTQRSNPSQQQRSERPDIELQLFLWTIWTAVVVAAGIQYEWGHMHTDPATALIGLAIRCALVGTIGLVVLTKIEMTLQPWRFCDGG